MSRKPKKERDIVTPDQRTYPKRQKTRRTYRTGWIDGQGIPVDEVAVSPSKNLPKPFDDYNPHFKWRLDAATAVTFNFLLNAWGCNRHEVCRRIWTPINRELRRLLTERNMDKGRNMADAIEVQISLPLRKDAWE